MLNNLILVVDDNEDLGRVLRRLLQRAGCEAESVTSGAAALASLKVRKPDLMVLDINMPGMDGLAVLRTLKGQSDLKDVNVMMYTADTTPEHKVQAERLGAVGFVLKGSLPLAQVIGRICELSAGPGQPGPGV